MKYAPLTVKEIQAFKSAGNKIKYSPTITQKNRKHINGKRPPEEKPAVEFTATTEFTCQQCDCRSCCRGLCPPMEWLVSQVEVEPSREAPTVDPCALPDDLRSVNWPSTPTTTEIIVKIYFNEGLKQPQIAKKLKVSQQYVSKVITTYRRGIAKLRPK